MAHFCGTRDPMRPYVGDPIEAMPALTTLLNAPSVQEEREAWDRFAAAFATADYAPIEAADGADQLLAQRRARFGGTQ